MDISVPLFSQLSKAKLSSLDVSLQALCSLEERVERHTANKAVLQCERVTQHYEEVLAVAEDSLQRIEDDIQLWNRFDDASSDALDRILAIEHEVASVSLPDDTAAKAALSQQFQVSARRG